MRREKDEPDNVRYALPTVFNGATIEVSASRGMPGSGWRGDFFIERPAGTRWLMSAEVHLGRSNALKIFRDAARELRAWYDHRCPKIQRTARERRNALRAAGGKEAAHA